MYKRSYLHRCPACGILFWSYNKYAQACSKTCRDTLPFVRPPRWGGNRRARRWGKGETMPYKNRCPVCRRQFESVRSDAITCSRACRKKRSRDKHKTRYFTFNEIALMAFEWHHQNNPTGFGGRQLTNLDRWRIIHDYVERHPYYLNWLV